MLNFEFCVCVNIIHFVENMLGFFFVGGKDHDVVRVPFVETRLSEGCDGLSFDSVHE